MRKVTVFTLLLVLGLFGFTSAATLMWTGDGGNSFWSNADNWDLDVIPGSEDIAVIDSNSAYGVIDPVVSVDIDTEIESLSIRPLDVNSTATLNIDNQSLQITNDDSSGAIVGTGEGTTYLQVTNGGYIGGEDLKRMRFATSPNSVVAYDLIDSQMVCKRFTFESGTSVWNATNSEIYIYPEDTEYDLLNSSATADTTLNWSNCYVLQPNIGNTDFEFGSTDRQVELRAITSGATVDINIVDCDIRWSGRWYLYRQSAGSVKFTNTDAWYNSLLWRSGPGNIEIKNSRIFTGGYQNFAAKAGGELLGLFENSTFRANSFNWSDTAQPGYLNLINCSVYVEGDAVDALGEDISAGKFVSNDSNGIIMGPLYKQSYTTTDQTGFTVVAFINDANEPWGFWPHDGRPEEVLIPSKLAWEPGANSASQTVYIGTDNTAVATGAGDVTVIGLSGDANDTTFETLPNKTYYWRVEAANGIDVWSGPVLEFTSSAGKATNPKPANQSTVEIVIGEATLEWVEGGSWVDTQDVWLGTSEDNMTKITTVAGNVNDVQLNSLIGNLELDTTYFWRIDSVDNGNNIPGGYTAEGDTWRFTTSNHYLVDEFETYNLIDNKIFDTWIEQGYAIVRLEEGEDAIVHGGAQAMGLDYLGDSSAKKSFSSSDFTS